MSACDGKMVKQTTITYCSSPFILLSCFELLTILLWCAFLCMTGDLEVVEAMKEFAELTDRAKYVKGMSSCV